MKYCPKCKSRYSDESLHFCLTDGERLVENNPSAPTLKIVPDLPPQPVVPDLEMIHKKATVNEGDYFEFQTKLRTIRITVKGIVEAEFKYGIALVGTAKEDGVHIHVTTGGGLVHGGSGTIEVKTNEYLVPAKDSVEERRSIYHFYVLEKEISFFRFISRAH